MAKKIDLHCKIHEDTKFLIECWLTSANYVPCEEVLSDYHDFRVASRLSKQGRERLHLLLPSTGVREPHTSASLLTLAPNSRSFVDQCVF
jgi:hypothetical protein